MSDVSSAVVSSAGEVGAGVPGVSSAAVSRSVVEVAVMASASIVADPARLSELERVHLAAIRGERRRDEWIRGRLAIRRFLGDPATSIIVDPDGAPRAVGGTPRSVSLSHDGDWIAVAVAGEGVRIGVDLCLRQHASRVKRIHAWLGVVTTLDPVIAWTALEVGLKLRRLSVEALRDRELVVEARGGKICVRGLGADAIVTLRAERDYIVAWATEPGVSVSSEVAPRVAVSSTVVSSSAGLVVSSPPLSTASTANAASASVSSAASLVVVSGAVSVSASSAAASSASVSSAPGAVAAERAGRA